jgi:hypothetical protein
MRYRTISRPLVLATALVGVGLAGCSDDDGPTGPVTPFDPTATAQAVSEMEDRLDGDSDVMMSLSLVNPAIEAEGGALTQLIPTGVVRPTQPFSAQLLVDPSFSMEPIFPSNFLGRTFEWDEGLGRYAMTDRVGAPANGIRFILYAIDPFTERPATPLNEVGLMDLTDEGDAVATRLGIRAETDGVTRLDYLVTASYALLGQNVQAIATGVGFISDGTRRLDFDLAQTVTLDNASGTMQVDLLYELRMDDEGIRVLVDAGTEIDLSASGIGLDVMMTITDGGNVTVFDAAVGQDESLSGTVRHNGETVVLMSGTTSAPVFTDAGGSLLTNAEVVALTQIFGLFDDVFDFVEEVFEPFGSEVASL